MQANRSEPAALGEGSGTRVAIGICLAGAVAEYLVLRGLYVPLLAPLTVPADIWPEAALVACSPIIWRTVVAVLLWNIGAAARRAAIALTIIGALPVIFSAAPSDVSLSSLLGPTGLFLRIVLVALGSLLIPLGLWLALGERATRAQLAIALVLFIADVIL